MRWESGRRSSNVDDRRGMSVTHRIDLRFSPDITSRHRFRDGERIFRILSLRDRDGRRRFLQIDAEERGA